MQYPEKLLSTNYTKNTNKAGNYLSAEYLDHPEKSVFHAKLAKNAELNHPVIRIRLVRISFMVTI